MDHMHFVNERLAAERQQRWLREAEERRMMRQVMQARRAGGMRLAVGAAVMRLGAWVAGQSLADIISPEGRLSSAG
ncbi:hypothetical protein [Sphaerobacter thermophilus]|uniref:Uncharacterized protein n=1 Tax=Sphaerobacter thermophilus (strain ATCC 49802 / DSM 20745 / KCCM 41009 / NCIMB 13125 / S 6022) TaxID=479434 RepID=D1C8C9_SPHTD|nr:hypothetical protein [Sphaerobacter thermophilus]ACZ40072.1 hypothetical protein Sthe_2658 [Sphaerobacter thermophilus DSM 20745]PZN68423.1 MAG: hypothetical protein DIU58_00090 [Sphaerobacter thermophilus]